MSGKTIGATLNNGFAGTYARQPDMIINTKPNDEASASIPFGSVVVIDSSSPYGVKLPTASSTAAQFAGIAARQVETNINYLNQNDAGSYAPSAPVSVFQRGRINYAVPNGTVFPNDEVYLAITTTGSNVVGTLCGSAKKGTVNTDTILLPNCKWGTSADSNGVAELVILYAVNG